MDSVIEVLPEFDSGKEIKWNKLGGELDNIWEAQSSEHPGWWRKVREEVETSTSLPFPSEHKFGVREDFGGKFVPSILYSERLPDGSFQLSATQALVDAMPTLGQAQVAARLAQEAYTQSISRSDWDNRVYDGKSGRFVLPSQTK